MDQATDTIDQVSARFRLNTQISKNIHDQGNHSYSMIEYLIITDDSSLCWAYASASMIRRSMKYFYEKHKNDNDINLTPAEQAELENWLEENKFHSILRSQITMNPIPKRIKKGETASARYPHEAHFIRECSERVSQVLSSLSHNESFR